MKRRGWFYRLLAFRLPMHAGLSAFVLNQLELNADSIAFVLICDALFIFFFNVGWYKLQKHNGITGRTGLELLSQWCAYTLICAVGAYGVAIA
jgi:hypothetical protein